MAEGDVPATPKEATGQPGRVPAPMPTLRLRPLPTPPTDASPPGFWRWALGARVGQGREPSLGARPDTSGAKVGGLLMEQERSKA